MKEIESVGIPAVQICTVTPIAESVGAPRIVPAVAIPYPLGNPSLPYEDEKALRRQLIDQALALLQREVL